MKKALLIMICLNQLWLTAQTQYYTHEDGKKYALRSETPDKIYDDPKVDSIIEVSDIIVEARKLINENRTTLGYVIDNVIKGKGKVRLGKFHPNYEIIKGPEISGDWYPSLKTYQCISEKTSYLFGTIKSGKFIILGSIAPYWIKKDGTQEYDGLYRFDGEKEAIAFIKKIQGVDLSERSRRKQQEAYQLEQEKNKLERLKQALKRGSYTETDKDGWITSSKMTPKKIESLTRDIIELSKKVIRMEHGWLFFNKKKVKQAEEEARQLRKGAYKKEFDIDVSLSIGQEFEQVQTQEKVLPPKMYEVQAYPNPTTDVITLQTDSDFLINRIEIYDAVGRLKNSFSNRIGLNETQLQVNYATGIYYLKVIDTKNNIVVTKKIVVQR